MLIIRILLKSGFVQSIFVCVTLAANLVVIGLRFNLSKSDWSGWVQAFGSIAAIFFAGVFASIQVRRQFRDSVRLQRRAAAELELNTILSVLDICEEAVARLFTVLRHINSDAEFFLDVAYGNNYLDLEPLDSIQVDLSRIETHKLPFTMASPMIDFVRIIRNANTDISAVRRTYRSIDGEGFDNFFTHLDAGHRDAALITLQFKEAAATRMLHLGKIDAFLS